MKFDENMAARNNWAQDLLHAFKQELNKARGGPSQPPSTQSTPEHRPMANNLGKWNCRTCSDSQCGIMHNTHILPGPFLMMNKCVANHTMFDKKAMPDCQSILPKSTYTVIIFISTQITDWCYTTL